uniref:DUF4220 domain-containing protein n=1 Tax=Daucus carota subsp. sativus TaxID=79200 RepID=A0A161XTC8_DAUCS
MPELADILSITVHVACCGTSTAYLLAEMLAIFGLGLIVSRQRLSSQYCKEKDEDHDNNHLHIFWAPFLLLHLGGPDTITAFAPEDNELWLRHLFYLASQCIAVAESINEKEALQKKACEAILNISTEDEMLKDKQIFFIASALAKKLKAVPSDKKWLIISKLWVEQLSYAASHIRSYAHAVQLSKGGEFITIVWLLMAHFGLGDQYEINLGNPE